MGLPLQLSETVHKNGIEEIESDNDKKSKTLRPIVSPFSYILKPEILLQKRRHLKLALQL